MSFEKMLTIIMSVFILSLAISGLIKDYSQRQIAIEAIKQGLEQQVIYKEGRTVQKIWVKKCIK